MKNIVIFILGLALVVLCCVLTVIDCNHNEVAPNYHLEPEGYVICQIETSDKFFSGSSYGYVKDEDLQLFENKELLTMKVLHPYEEGKYVLINPDEIIRIITGEYKDLQ